MFVSDHVRGGAAALIGDCFLHVPILALYDTVRSFLSSSVTIPGG